MVFHAEPDLNQQILKRGRVLYFWGVSITFLFHVFVRMRCVGLSPEKTLPLKHPLSSSNFYYVNLWHHVTLWANTLADLEDVMANQCCACFFFLFFLDNQHNCCFGWRGVFQKSCSNQGHAHFQHAKQLTNHRRVGQLTNQGSLKATGTTNQRMNEGIIVAVWWKNFLFLFPRIMKLKLTK